MRNELCQLTVEDQAQVAGVFFDYRLDHEVRVLRYVLLISTQRVLCEFSLRDIRRQEVGDSVDVAWGQLPKGVVR